MLRLTIGPMMMTHGLNKVRGPGGMEGPHDGSPGSASSRQPCTRVAAATEIGTGALLTVGAMTPMAAAGVVGVMTSAAATDHKGKGFFIFKGGWEYVAVVAGVVTAIAALGPGRISIDGLRGKPHGGFLPGPVGRGLRLRSRPGRPGHPAGSRVPRRLSRRSWPTTSPSLSAA